MDLVGFLEVGAEEEEREVCILADWCDREAFGGKNVRNWEC